MRRWLPIFVAVLLTCATALAQSSVRMPDGEIAAVQRSASAAQAKLKDATRLVGVDMSWYANAQPDPHPFTDDDRADIKELLSVSSFYDRTLLLHLSGDAQRAVGIVELIRDRDFHSGKGEVIWRAEIWYFEFQSGGWAKVSQQNKLLDRQRFSSADKYLAYVRKLRFVPRLSPSAATTQGDVLQLTLEDIIAPSAAR